MRIDKINHQHSSAANGAAILSGEAGIQAELKSSMMQSSDGPEGMVKAGQTLFGRELVRTQEDVARRGAEELVANALILPAFKMMREDPLQSDLLGKAPGQEAFESMWDQEIANRLARSAQLPLVDSVARRLLRKHASPMDGAAVAHQGAGLNAYG